MKYIAPAAQTVKNKLKTLIKKLWFKSRRTVKNAEKRIKAQTAKSHRSEKENLSAEQALEKKGRLKIKVREKAVIRQ